jgi:hypothetical protein
MLGLIIFKFNMLAQKISAHKQRRNYNAAMYTEDKLLAATNQYHKLSLT